MQPPTSGVRGAMGVHADEPAGEIPPKCCSTAEGGNGICHCWHVTQLDTRVAVLENARAPAPAGMPTGDGGPNRRAPFVGGASAASPDTGVWDKTKIIDEKPLNMLSGDKFAERSLFDEKVASSSGYQYDGTKGGVAWKMKVRGYFISKVPALVGILKWAEKHDQDKVEADSFDSVVSHFMGKPRQDVLNTQIW